MMISVLFRKCKTPYVSNQNLMISYEPNQMNPSTILVFIVLPESEHFSGIPRRFRAMRWRAQASPPRRLRPHCFQTLKAVFPRFPRGTAPREEGRRGRRQGPAGAALGAGNGGEHVNRFTCSPRFPSSVSRRAGRLFFLEFH